MWEVEEFDMDMYRSASWSGDSDRGMLEAQGEGCELGSD